MKNTRVIVLTTRRKNTGFKYLQQLLSQFPVDAVYVDGTLSDAQDISIMGEVTYSGRRMGGARATHAALKWASTHWPGKKVLFLEDDVLPAVELDELRKVLEKLEPTDTNAALCLCDMRELPEGQEPGVYPVSPLGVDGDGWWGNQALLFRPDTLKWLAEQDWFSDRIENSEPVRLHKQYWKDDGVQCSDCRLGLLILDHPMCHTIGVHVPSLFYHVGEDSICFPGEALGKRRTRNLPASTKDCLDFQEAFCNGTLKYLARAAGVK